MRMIFRVLIFLFLSILSVIFLEKHLISVWGILPNLVLVLLLLFSFFETSWKYFISFHLLFLGISSILFPFWVLPFLLLSLFSFLARLVRKKLIGYLFLDFLILISIFTALFYVCTSGVLNISNWIFLLGVEIILNLIVGAISFWIASKHIDSYAKY